MGKRKRKRQQNKKKLGQLFVSNVCMQIASERRKTRFGSVLWCNGFCVTNNNHNKKDLMHDIYEIPYFDNSSYSFCQIEYIF